jgi:hypothetical protein
MHCNQRLPTTADGRGRVQRDRAKGHGESGQNPSGQFAKRSVCTEDCTVEASAVRGIDGNAAGGVWRAVGGERRPTLQVRGDLNDVIQVGFPNQRELKLATGPGKIAQLRHWNERKLKDRSGAATALRCEGIPSDNLQAGDLVCENFRGFPLPGDKIEQQISLAWIIEEGSHAGRKVGLVEFLRTGAWASSVRDHGQGPAVELHDV